jgi:SAM-dependent MidA family methyltransferase
VYRRAERQARGDEFVSGLGIEELAHVERVRERIAAEIDAAGGWIGFDRYMEIALYAPGLGYYSAGAHKLGPGGDFITAPEVSRLFGGCIARQCAEILGALGRGRILEIGAGSGRLAADVLSRLDALGCLPERYLVLEISADLRERQRRCIANEVPHLAHRVEWLDAPPDAAFDGVVLANEVLDALPVTRFRWHARQRGCEEMGVARDGLRFEWAPRTGSDALAAECERLAAAGGGGGGGADVGAGAGGGVGAGSGVGGCGGWGDGYTSEYCERLTAWTAAVTSSHRAGLALWIDYGLPRRQYYFPERRDGTLICHFRGRVLDDPFFAPGLLDISAWVDFTRLAQASTACGYTLAGYTTQAHFLAGLSIDGEMHHLAGTDPTRFARLANEARTLLLPGEMGERFKVMAWMRGMESPLPAFQVQDLRHTL